MKLKNKRTGEIKDWDFGNWYQTILNPENKEKYECNLNDFIDRTVKFREEWEDYEEPKEYWYLSGRGEVGCIEDDGVKFDKECKQIGNYFSSREEAEKAVEKLKAWKRLKDAGFRFDHIRSIDGVSIKYKDLDQYTIIAYADEDGCDQECLDLLFSQEGN